MFALPHKGYRLCGFFLPPNFPALFPSWQRWGRVRSSKETWLYLLSYGFSPTAFDKPWQCSPNHSTHPKPAKTDSRKESLVFLQKNPCRTSGRAIHSVWEQRGAAMDAKSLSQSSPSRQGRKNGEIGQTVCQRDEVIAQQGEFGRKSMLWLDSTGHRSV